MMRFAAVLFAGSLLLSGCGQSAPPEAASETAESEVAAAPDAALNAPPVDPILLAAANSEFMAIEPTEIGVIGSPNVLDAIAPLTALEDEGATDSVHVSVRETGEDAVADIVRSGLADDSIGAGHVRVEFRREEDGWYPTNAYRRAQCRRAADPSAWSAQPCP